LIDNLVN